MILDLLQRLAGDFPFAWSMALSIAHIEGDAHCQRKKKEDRSPYIDDCFTDRQRREFCDEEVYVRIAIGSIAQFVPYLPVPVCKKTISKAIAYSQTKPWDRREKQSDQIPFPQRSRGPSKKIKKNERNMKHEKKGIRKFVECYVFHLRVLQGLLK